MPGIVSRLLSRVFDRSPALPQCPDRRCVLTPSPSSESIMRSSQAAVRGSPLFQKIPFEIRRMILIAAFGDRVMHMDLIFDHPRKPLAERKLDPDLQYHAYLGSRVLQERMSDKRRRKRWQWQSSVYVEGIEVLYQKNTIHIPSIHIFRHLPRFLPAQRLANLRSVELVWELHMFQNDEPVDPPFCGHSAFLRYLEVLPTMLPGLGNLFLSLQGRFNPPSTTKGDRYEIVNTIIGKPIDAMVRRMGLRLRKFDLALPFTVYSKFNFKISGRHGLGITRPYNFQWERVWRDLLASGTEDGAPMPYISGYWIYRGYQDFPYHPELND
ncbi:hypothetical protein FQN49_005774 [Arthroderma sp. PD_2]|nr:hypothetical protein FQN49_005774 [Arthroderma sp. PD_2]